MTVYARSGDLAQIVGQDRITLTPQNLEFTVSQGRSSTLLGSRKIAERREDSYDAPGGRRDKLTTTVEITLTNRGPRPADAWIRDGVEPFADNRWTVLSSSSPAERLGANTVQFKVEVPAGGKTTVTYTVETK